MIKHGKSDALTPKETARQPGNKVAKQDARLFFDPLKGSTILHFHDSKARGYNVR